jgi:hypothetical protein
MGMWIWKSKLKHRKELLSFSQMASPYTKSKYLLIISIVKIAPPLPSKVPSPFYNHEVFNHIDNIYN